MAGKPKLIIHIGAGKTGTTAIQQLCDAQRSGLLEQGIRYLGPALEYCDTRAPFDWQIRNGSAALLHELADDDAEAQVHSVLAEEIDRHSATGVSTLFWSNEALFERNAGVIPALRRLMDDGVDVEAIVYLRRHDAWARSAYAQWGICHKSYTGPVKSFREWIADHPVRFADTLEAWDKALGKRLSPRNYDQADDVAAEVLEALGAGGLTSRRALKTPGPVELSAWAVFNSRQHAEVKPTAFRELLESYGLGTRDRTAVPEPEHLMPSADDLAAVQSTTVDDAKRVNRILEKSGQPPLSSVPLSSLPEVPDNWQLIQFLMELTFSQQEQINDLKNRLDDLGG